MNNRNTQDKVNKLFKEVIYKYKQALSKAVENEISKPTKGEKHLDKLPELKEEIK
jgi:hypothetical protein